MTRCPGRVTSQAHGRSEVSFCIWQHLSAFTCGGREEASVVEALRAKRFDELGQPRIAQLHAPCNVEVFHRAL